MCSKSTVRRRQPASLLNSDQSPLPLTFPKQSVATVRHMSLWRRLGLPTTHVSQRYSRGRTQGKEIQVLTGVLTPARTSQQLWMLVFHLFFFFLLLCNHLFPPRQYTRTENKALHDGPRFSFQTKHTEGESRFKPDRC